METDRIGQHLGFAAVGCLAAALLACGSSGSSTAPGTSSRFLYVANMESHQIAGFAIDAPSGKLTSLGAPAVATADVRSLVATPDGAFLYAGNQDTGRIDAYAIDATTGALTALSGTNPPPYVTADQVIRLTVDPAGKFLYSCNMGGTISAFSIGADGKLTLVGEYSSELYGVATAGQVHPSGKWLYVTTQGPDSVVQWTIGADGSLSNAVRVEVGGNNGALAIDSTGKFLYVIGGATHFVWGFRIDAETGALSATTPASFDLGSNSFGSIAIDPGGRFLYADGGGNTIHGFSIDAAGSLTPTPRATLSYSGYPSGIATDADGVFLYMGMGSANALACARIDRTTGSLTKVFSSEPTGGTYATGVTVVGRR